MKLSQLYKSELYLKLSKPTYSIAETSRLVGISRGRVKRWLKGYSYSYWVKDDIRFGKQDPLVRPGDTKEYSYASFLDIIDLLFVKQFVKNGLSLQYIRKALAEVRSEFEIPHFASERFITFGQELLLHSSEKNKYVRLLSGGQFAFPDIVEEIGNTVDFEDITSFGLATKWYPNGENGLIVIDPQISFGRPTISGRGIATENIYDFYLGEDEDPEPVEKWFNITRNEISAAVDFEFSLLS